MKVRDLLYVVPSTQIVEIRKVDSQRTDRLSKFIENIVEQMNYIDKRISVMTTYIENNTTVLRLLVY